MRTRNLDPPLDLSPYEGIQLRLFGDGQVRVCVCVCVCWVCMLDNVVCLRALPVSLFPSLPSPRRSGSRRERCD